MLVDRIGDLRLAVVPFHTHQQMVSFTLQHKEGEEERERVFVREGEKKKKNAKKKKTHNLFVKNSKNGPLVKRKHGSGASIGVDGEKKRARCEARPYI